MCLTILYVLLSTPQPNKIEAFKDVIQKLPQTNYDNIKYLIKFLNKIVDNSDKTKMTNTNLGICFGVSLLSNSSAINMNIVSPYTITNHNSSSIENAPVKSIDMATATNVFDFILNNHKELFPGEISFSTNSIRSKPSFHQSTNSIYHGTMQKSSTNSSALSSNNNETNQISNEIASPNTPSNAIVNSVLSQGNNVMHLNRHVKKNSMDSNKFMDNESTPISSNSSFALINNSMNNNNQFGSIGKHTTNIFE